MATSTRNGDVYAAVQWKQLQETAWVAIARQADWNNDSNPPPEERSTSSLDDVIGYVKVTNAYLTTLESELKTSDTYSTYTHKNQTWVVVPEEKAYAEMARQVVFEVTFSGERLPAVPFHQTGVYLDLVPSNGETGTTLLPDQVMNLGTLIQYQNDSRVTLSEDRTTTARIMFNFDQEKTKQDIV